MEKNEKNESRTQMIYFNLVDFIGRDVKGTLDVYKFLDNQAEKFGVSQASMYSSRAKLVARFERITKKWLDVAEDGKQGMIKKRLYSFKLTKGREYEDLNRIKSDIKSFTLLHTRGRSVSKISEMVSEAKKGRKIVEKVDKTVSIQPSVIEKITKVISKMGENQAMSFVTIAETLGIKYGFQKLMVDSWNKSLMRLKSPGYFKVFKSSKNSKECLIKLEGASTSTMLALLNQYYKKSTGKFIITGDNNTQLKKSVENMEKMSPAISEINSTDSYTLYAIGGILKSNNGKAINYVDLCKILREKFAINTCKAEVEKLVKTEKEIEIVSFGQSLRLLTANSWKVLREKYSPFNLEGHTFVRLGMSLEEVREYFPKTELVSKISDTDGIYKLVYSRSRSDWRTLIGLFRTFRGSDKLLDEVLEFRLKLEVESEKKTVEVNDFAFQIEKIED